MKLSGDEELVSSNDFYPNTINMGWDNISSNDTKTLKEPLTNFT